MTQKTSEHDAIAGLAQQIVQTHFERFVSPVGRVSILTRTPAMQPKRYHNYDVEIDGETSIITATTMERAHTLAVTAALGVALKKRHTVTLTIQRQTSAYPPHSETVTALGLKRDAT